MSEKNAELVRRAMRAFNQRDIEGIGALTHPEAEIELFGGFADLMGKRFQGTDGVRRFYSDWFRIFETMQVEIERSLEAGDQLVTLTRLEATVKGSDAPVELLSAVVFGFKDGRINHVGFYYDRDEALEAAGLST